MKTLIITVGTRQIGWKCRDGVVRSFGADGDRGAPLHLDELYQEFGVTRGNHDDHSKYSVRYLSEIIYQHCQATQDFAQVVFLLDEKILAAHYGSATDSTTDEVILWGTDQPESVPWQFRRSDTLWVAKLMAGAMAQRYPHLKVTVWISAVDVKDVLGVRQFTEQQLQAYLGHLPQNPSPSWRLQIQTKGSVPQIASALDLSAALLIRQYPVEQLIPLEPSPFYDPVHQSARCAETFEALHLGQVFWPLEQQRIITAWQRGDFTAAKLLLETHRDRHEALYQLADRLALASNWGVEKMLKSLQGQRWLDQKTTRAVAGREHCRRWTQAIQARCPDAQTADSKLRVIWEFELLIDLSLRQENYTLAFMQFAQMLERLLFWRFQVENWREKGYLGSPAETPDPTAWERDPTLGSLRRAWVSCHQVPEEDPRVKTLETINSFRNRVVHRHYSIERSALAQLVGAETNGTEADLHQALVNFLVRDIQAPPPEPGVARSLYEWGLAQIECS